MWNDFRKKRAARKFEFGGNTMTRIFFPMILLFFVALSKISFTLTKKSIPK